MYYLMIQVTGSRFKCSSFMVSWVNSVPSPDCAVITDPNQHPAISGPGGLPHCAGALGVAELHAPDLPGLLLLEVPHPDPPHLVTQGQHLLAGVEAESHEPDVTVPEVELVNDNTLVLYQLIHLILFLLFLRLLIKTPGLPANYLVLAALGEDEVTEPAAAVHIVPVDVPSGEVREVAELSGESLLGPDSVVTVGGFYCLLELLCVKPKSYTY